MTRFRGGYPATVDAKGRFKLPARLREQLETGYGREVYVCSLFPGELSLYPLAEWESFEERLLSKSAFKPAVRKLVERASYGQSTELDDHGRILIPVLLRSVLDLEGEVVVSGRINHLVLTRRERADEILKDDTLSHEELEELADLEL